MGSRGRSGRKAKTKRKVQEQQANYGQGRGPQWPRDYLITKQPAATPEPRRDAPRTEDASA
jgi:hypothetical protein